MDSITAGNNQIETGSSVAFPADIYSFSFDVTRGDVTDAATLKTLLTSNNMTILSINVQDVTVSPLDSDLSHIGVVGWPSAPGQIATSSISNATRAALHELRTTNLGMAFCWSALGSGDAWLTPAASNEHAVVHNSTSWANMIDAAYGSRGADTPGWLCSGYKMGTGDEDTTAGKSVWIKPYIYAMGVNANLSAEDPAGEVKFEGPAGTTTTSSTTVINCAAAPEWYEGDAFCVNSSVTDAASDATANKVDPMVKSYEAAGSPAVVSTIYVYGMFGHYVFAP
jgi:hypothetical protein